MLKSVESRFVVFNFCASESSKNYICVRMPYAHVFFLAAYSVLGINIVHVCVCMYNVCMYVLVCMYVCTCNVCIYVLVWLMLKCDEISRQIFAQMM